MVWPPEIQIRLAGPRDPRKLADRPAGIRAAGANRIGHGHFSAAQLKTIQEVITLTVFAAFSVLYLKEPLTWNHALGFAFIALGAFFIFHKWA